MSLLPNKPDALYTNKHNNLNSEVIENRNREIRNRYSLGKID